MYWRNVLGSTACNYCAVSTVYGWYPLISFDRLWHLVVGVRSPDIPAFSVSQNRVDSKKGCSLKGKSDWLKPSSGPSHKVANSPPHKSYWLNHDERAPWPTGLLKDLLSETFRMRGNADMLASHSTPSLCIRLDRVQSRALNSKLIRTVFDKPMLQKVWV